MTKKNTTNKKYDINQTELIGKSIKSRALRGDPMAKFAFRLAALLDKDDLSLDEFAEKCGVSTSSIGGYLRCERIPKLDSVIKIAKYLGVSIDYLVGGAECTTPENSEVNKLLGLSDLSINRLKNLIYVTEKIPDYQINELDSDPASLQSIPKSYYYHTENQNYIPISAADVLDSFEDLGNIKKAPYQFFDFLNLLLCEDDFKTLVLMATYVNAPDVQLPLSINRNLDIVEGFETPYSPFEYSLPLTENIPSFFIAKIIESLANLRQTRKERESKLINPSLREQKGKR